MFLMPIIGFLGASYSKSGVEFFGWQLPTWVARNHDTSEMFFSAHIALALVQVSSVALHAAGGLKHFFIDKDGVFQRMWF
jgi:cytochrome b561